MLDLSEPYQFDWDQGNIKKNLIKHGIECKDGEEIFLDEKLVFGEDVKHSISEKRYLAIGKTAKYKLLAVIFTVRNQKVRIISARKANNKERNLYEK